MKRLVLASIFLIPSYVFADRLGSLNPNSQVSLSTQAIQNRNTLQSGATFYVSSGTVDGQLSVNSVASSGFGNEFSQLKFILSNNTFLNQHVVKFKRYGSSGFPSLSFQNMGNDENNVSAWEMGNQSSGMVLRTWDSDNAQATYQNYMMQGNGDGHGETVINSSGTNNLNLNLWKSALTVAGYSGFNAPIFQVYSDDGGADDTGSSLKFEVHHGSITSNNFHHFTSSMTLSGNYTVQNIPPSNGQVLKFDGTNWAPGTDNSGSISPSSTSWIQNTLTPTTTTQVFSVSTGTMFSAVISSQITSPGPLTQSEHYGAFSQANSSGATVIGANAVIAEFGNSTENTVIGANTKIISSVQGSPAGRSTAVGADTTCDGHNATAVGAAQTVSANGVGVGYGNTVGNAGTAVGISLTVGGNAVAMGLVANAGATNSIALARAADASAGGVAVGYQSKTSAPGDVALASRTNGSVGGTKIRLQGNSSTTSQQTLAQITSAWADSTHATRKSQLDLLNTDFNGDKTFLRGEADGTTAMTGIGIASTTANTKLSVYIDSNTYAGLVVKSTVSQTANPIEVWDSNNVVKSSITSAGIYWSGGKRVCLEDGTNCTASGGGVSGVGPPIAVGTGTASNFTNNVTSPTAAISFEGTQFKSFALGTSNYIVIDTMSSTGLMVISSMTNYMTQSSATANDLTLSSAAATYQYKGNYLTSVSGFGPSVAVGTGTSSNFTTSVTSPTMAIDLEGADFTSTALGTTNYVKLNNTGVTAGSYTTPNITVDAKGRITAATSVAASTGTNAIFSSTMDFKDLNSTAISTITSSFGVGSLTLAANFFTQGQSIDFYAVGYSSSAGNSATTLRIRVSLGTATVMDSGAVTINAGLANLSNTFFRIDGNMACRTTGTSGTAIGQVTWRHNLGASSPGGVSGAVAEMFPATTTTTTFDTTAQQIFNVSFQWNTAATTNGLVITNYVVSKN